MSAAIEALNPRQVKFIAAYVADPEHDASSAAVSAGYKVSSAQVQGWALLKRSDIRAALAEARDQIMAVAVFDAAQVLNELVPLATSNVLDYMDSSGQLLSNLSLVPKRAAKAIQSLRQTVAADGSVTTEIKLWSKPEALKLAGNHTNVQAYLERVQLTGTLSDRMNQVQAEANSSPVTIDVQAKIQERMRIKDGVGIGKVEEAEVVDE